MKIKFTKDRILDGEQYLAGREYEVESSLGVRLLATFPMACGAVGAERPARKEAQPSRRTRTRKAKK